MLLKAKKGLFCLIACQAIVVSGKEVIKAKTVTPITP